MTGLGPGDLWVVPEAPAYVECSNSHHRPVDFDEAERFKCGSCDAQMCASCCEDDCHCEKCLRGFVEFCNTGVIGGGD